mgnify:CR=1 FL=1
MFLGSVTELWHLRAIVQQTTNERKFELNENPLLSPPLEGLMGWVSRCKAHHVLLRWRGLGSLAMLISLIPNSR